MCLYWLLIDYVDSASTLDRGCHTHDMFLLSVLIVVLYFFTVFLFLLFCLFFVSFFPSIMVICFKLMFFSSFDTILIIFGEHIHINCYVSSSKKRGREVQVQLPNWSHLFFANLCHVIFLYISMLVIVLICGFDKAR